MTHWIYVPFPEETLLDQGREWAENKARQSGKAYEFVEAQYYDEQDYSFNDPPVRNGRGEDELFPRRKYCVRPNDRLAAVGNNDVLYIYAHGLSVRDQSPSPPFSALLSTLKVGNMNAYYYMWELAALLAAEGVRRNINVKIKIFACFGRYHAMHHELYDKMVNERGYHAGRIYVAAYSRRTAPSGKMGYEHKAAGMERDEKGMTEVLNGMEENVWYATYRAKLHREWAPNDPPPEWG